VAPGRRTTSRADAQRLDCDVLVLGAGLAGQRAAWAAAEFARDAAPGLRVLVASPFARPSGSSFANRNNALGMQAPAPDQFEAFTAEVLRLAGPAHVDPTLVRAMAHDAPALLAELTGLGLDFRRGPDGSLARFPGCFSAAPRAVVFDGLAQAHAAFQARAVGLGARFLHGYAAVGLDQTSGGRVCGAQLAALRGHGDPSHGDTATRLDVRAKAVVAAIGGPAALFARRICGPGGLGLSCGLLSSAGARLVNAPYMQFFWIAADSLDFINPGELPWPESAAELAAARRGHCPVANALPDRALDLALLARQNADGVVRVPDRPAMFLAAHAGNGGALVDISGRTTAPGLYACGECAGGMHGADRMGGCMVLAALALGARAGEAAAREAAGRARLPAPATPQAEATLRPPFMARLRRGMQRHGLPGPSRREQGRGRAAFVEWLRRAAAASGREALAARSALAVLGEDVAD
jgi:L-aspartate oxidase